MTIISASRRTDIPAFYSEWFLNRLREGFCITVNPFNSKQVSRISLDPRDTEAIVFWTKNAAPILPFLSEIDALGHRYYFQFTLNDYPEVLEPGLPPLEQRLLTFEALSDRIGPDRVIWRYDPIIVSNKTPTNWHAKKFENLANLLVGSTRRVMVSIVDFYKKTDRRLKRLEDQEFVFEYSPESSKEIYELLDFMKITAEHCGIEIFMCAEENDFRSGGIPPGKCIDDDLLSRLFSLHLGYGKDKNQRKSCGCIVSKDIGIADTCVHGCPYCYATRNANLAQRRHEQHDTNSPLLWGNAVLPPEDKTAKSIQLDLQL